MNSPKPSISRLHKVPIRDIWPSEPQDFTPWLASAENLSLLGETIGIRLELQSTEESVGDFRADIVCKSLPEGELVLVENQFAQTDHIHLGQILTYAAGLEAFTIVWIAERFREEHRAAIDWLNAKTPGNINFFALEMELWRIADSPVAPKFNIVCKPNEWARTMAEASRPTTEQSEFRWAYWSGFIQQPVLAAIVARPLGANRQGNLPVCTPWQNFIIQVYTSNLTRSSAVYLSGRGPDRFQNLEKLLLDRERIEAALGDKLSWDMNRGSNRAWVIWSLPDLDPSDRAHWPQHQQALAAKVVEFYRVLDPFIRPIDQSQTLGPTE